jgi:hypothetical protein
MMKGYEYQSDFAKKYVAQGHAEGLTKGRTEEAARAVDPERLERWLEKAAVAASVAAVLDEPN